MPGNLSKFDEITTKTYKETLEKNGYNVIYYIKDNYPEYGQLSRVRESIMESSAIIALGFKQVNIKNRTYYPNTPKQKDITDKWLSTPWNELEVGMGIMKNLPILLVKDSSIESGIFDDKLSECFVATIPSDYDCRKLESNLDFNRWLDRI